MGRPMTAFRAFIVAALLGGLAAGCSGPSSSKPANAPPPEEEKPLGAPKAPAASKTRKMG
jgi:hypothetical protein